MGGNVLTEIQILSAIEHDAALGMLWDWLRARFAHANTAVAIAAVVVVFVLMWLNVGSLFIAIAAVLEVLLSFPTAYWFYRVVLSNVSSANSSAISNCIPSLFTFFPPCLKSITLAFSMRLRCF